MISILTHNSSCCQDPLPLTPAFYMVQSLPATSPVSTAYSFKPPPTRSPPSELLLQVTVIVYSPAVCLLKMDGIRCVRRETWVCGALLQFWESKLSHSWDFRKAPARILLCAK